MKNLLLSICLIFYAAGFAQQPVHVTPKQLFDEISTSNKATVVQFFNPNCADSLKIMSGYKRLQEKYYDAVDFYFIAITSKDHLIASQVKITGYSYKIYVADASVEADLYERRQVFCKSLNTFFKANNDDFLTLYLDTKDSTIYAGDDVNIKEEALKALYD